MPTRSLDACFFIKTTPDILYEDGLFKVGYQIGKDAYFEVCLPPKVFNEAMLCAAEAHAKWRMDGLPSDNVSPIKKGKRGH